jgi:hypothetical protein
MAESDYNDELKWKADGNVQRARKKIAGFDCSFAKWKWHELWVVRVRDPSSEPPLDELAMSAHTDQKEALRRATQEAKQRLMSRHR